MPYSKPIAFCYNHDVLVLCNRLVQDAAKPKADPAAAKATDAAKAPATTVPAKTDEEVKAAADLAAKKKEQEEAKQKSANLTNKMAEARKTV